MAKFNIGMDEWLNELRRLCEAAPEGALSTRELAEKTGLGMATAGDRICAMIYEGKMRHAGYRISKRMDGGRCRTPVYAMIAPPDNSTNKKKKYPKL